MKLAGLKVLDLSMFLPGPMVTLMLADHGADVIKIEPMGAGEPTREIGEVKNGLSVYFRNTQRGKRSIQLNLKDEDQRALFLRLAAEADVIVEAYRPGVADRLGVGYAAVSAINPAIVYASLSAFGQEGRHRDNPAHDLAVQALAGTLPLGADSAGRPVMPGALIADAFSSLTALSGILMALYRRATTGRGDFVDISMFDSVIAWTPHATGPVFARGEAPELMRSRFWGGAAMYGLYQTLDERWIALGGSEIKFAENLLAKLGRLDLLPLARQPPGDGQEPLRAFFRQTFATKTQAHWVEWFEGLDVCFAPVRTLAEAFADPFLAERGMLSHDADGSEVIGTPIRFRNEPGAPNPRAPQMNEHAEEIARHGWARGRED
ncbi:CaiB/BaiF CoA transferase family protein [Phenylobacterium montanum]|uniref:CoA transferase n=1 Tax=Phenylobacterium montanum TaxID=2823693 RepID=A0A975G4N4_9CAUL|nr:CoA transferase [Caulobacter sp. S6]QUD89966.1 CoA transferase [Caulobacter sp. S6]